MITIFTIAYYTLIRIRRLDIKTTIFQKKTYTSAYRECVQYERIHSVHRSSFEK